MYIQLFLFLKLKNFDLDFLKPIIDEGDWGRKVLDQVFQVKDGVGAEDELCAGGYGENVPDLTKHLITANTPTATTVISWMYIVYFAGKNTSPSPPKKNVIPHYQRRFQIKRQKKTHINNKHLREMASKQFEILV